MLAYFPAIYPGELLYSVLGRLHRHFGGTKPMDTMKTLFGTRTAVASPDLPGHLQALAERIPKNRGLTTDRIIDELTLFPYYTAFEPPEVQKRARCAMVEGRSQDLHLRLGLVAFRTGRVTAFRFCRRCLIEMRRDYGEWYWRRDHQLAGVLLCPDHGCVLQESTVALARHSRHEFIAASPENCLSTSRPLVDTTDIRVMRRLERLARQSRDLLTQQVTPRSFRDWTHFYRRQLIEVGLARSPLKMDQARFHQEFLRYYGDALHHLPNVLADRSSVGSWLAAMVRTHRHAMHPMHHLLLQEFLADRETKASPFGTGPWPCLNPLAKHRTAFPVKKCPQHRNRGNTVGVFSCTCGYVYTRCFNSVTRQLGPPRFQLYGPLLEPALRQMFAAGTSLRENARQLRLDPKTVVSLAHELGIPVTWMLRPSRHFGTKANIPVTKKGSRPSLGHESHRPGNHARPRRDWTRLDIEWRLRIKATEIEILSAVPPIRVTLAELERRLCTRGWLGKRSGKLPKSTAQIARVVESVEDFQSRRIHWAIAEIESVGGKSARAWQVMRKAGLRASSLPRIQMVLDAPTDTSHRRAVA